MKKRGQGELENARRARRPGAKRNKTPTFEFIDDGGSAVKTPYPICGSRHALLVLVRSVDPGTRGWAVDGPDSEQVTARIPTCMMPCRPTARHRFDLDVSR
jgi:hypothetical protein